MNMNRPDTTETVKFENYTNKFLQKDSNPTTMEVVTQTNAVKSPKKRRQRTERSKSNMSWRLELF